MCTGCACVFFLILAMAACAPTPIQDNEALLKMAADTSDGRLPVNAFASLPVLAQVQISPSGEHLAFIQNLGGKTYLVTQRIAGQELHILLEADNNKYFMDRFVWVNSERLLVSTYFPEIRRAVKTIERRLIAVNRDGTDLKGDIIKIRPSLRDIPYSPQIQDTILGIIPNDPRYVLIALDLDMRNLPDVYKLDVYSGQVEQIQRNLGGIYQWIADRAGEVRIGYGWDKTVVHIAVKPPASAKWLTLAEYDVARSDGTKVPMWPLGFEADPRFLYVLGAYEGRAAVFKVDLLNPQFPRQLVSADPQYDIEARLIYAPWLGKVVGLSYEADSTKSIYWDEQVQRLQARIDRSLPKRINTIINSSAAGRRHVIASESAVHPPQFYVMDEDTNRISNVANTYPQLPRDQLVELKEIAFKARDGWNLRGYLTVPTGRDPRNLPTILFPHGGPASRDTKRFDYWTQFFASRGWAVLQVNFRGSSGYGNRFLTAGFKRWGLEMQDDLTDGVEWLVQQGIADPKKICIVGASYGGYAALMGAAKTPDLYRCAVSFAGVSDLRDLLREKMSYLGYEIGWERQLGAWWDDRRRLKETSPVNHAEKIRIPLLIMHGAEDRVVPVQQSRDMVDALKIAGARSVRYVELPLGDHHLSREEDRLQVFIEMNRFLKQCLDGAP